MRLSEKSYLSGLLGIFVGDRVDLSVGGPGVQVCLQEGLDVRIGTVGAPGWRHTIEH